MVTTSKPLETTENSITPNNWHHVAFSYGSNNIVNMYVDGVIKYTESNIDIGHNSIDNNNIEYNSVDNHNIVIGSNIDGKIDKFKIFNKERNGFDIQYLSRPGNNDTAQQDTICDLRFNETNMVPVNIDNQQHSNVCVSVGNVEYDDGFVHGSKSINTNDGHILIQEDPAIYTDTVSVSA